MYELFSNGTSFHFSGQIRDRQLLMYLNNWLAGDPQQAILLDVSEVTHGQIHGWQERLRVTVTGLENEDWPQTLRQARDLSAAGMQQVHETWRRRLSRSS